MAIKRLSCTQGLDQSGFPWPGPDLRQEGHRPCLHPNAPRDDPRVLSPGGPGAPTGPRQATFLEGAPMKVLFATDGSRYALAAARFLAHRLRTSGAQVDLVDIARSAPCSILVVRESAPLGEPGGTPGEPL